MERPKASASKLRHEHNLTFDHLLWEAEHGRLPRELSKAMTRPAYQHTSIEQKKLFANCSRCGYFKKNESGKMSCQFPWSNPHDYDKVLLDYLPCKEGEHAKD